MVGEEGFMVRKVLCITPFLVLAIASLCLAEKVTTDPNARPAQSQSAVPEPQAARYDPAKDPDKRMAAKVSYEAPHSRLGNVVADLAQKTGVIIKCGTSKNDWQVRDIPLTVYAKDLPLGTVLRALAHATHTAVRTVKLDDGLSYQICHTAAMTKALAEYGPKTMAYEHALRAEGWDSCARIKDMPDSQLDSRYKGDGASGAAQLTLGKRISALVSALGADYRERAIDCECISITTNDVPDAAREPLRQVIDAGDAIARASISLSSDTRTEPLSQDEIDKVAITIRPLVEDMPAILSIGFTYRHYGDYAWCRGLTGSDYIKRKSKEWEKLVASWETIRLTRPQLPKDDSLSLDLPHGAKDEIDLLKRKLDLHDLDDNKELSLSQVAFEVAKRAGFSIMLEDWRFYWSGWPKPVLQQDMEVGRILQDLDTDMWHVDDNGSLIVGIIGGWEGFNVDLVPAAVVDNLRTKLAGAGADFEDVLPLESWTAGQFRQWAWRSPDIGDVAYHCRNGDMLDPARQPGRDALWQFYASLSAEDRALADTTAGLPLAKFDANAMLELVKQENKDILAVRHSPLFHGISTDSAAIPDLTLRLQRFQRPSYLVGPGRQYSAPEGKAMPQGLDFVWDYGLLLCNRTGTLLCVTGPKGLPFYSAKRQAELLKPFANKPSPK
jgi:hypothetical protein